MLSIGSVGSASGAASYYTSEDNYYFLGDLSTEWFGKGANELGLTGSVDKEQFQSVLEGFLPDGSDLSFIKNGENKHQAGYDLTFSAPKSVSILALVEGDKDILNAHKEAVKKTLNEIESLISTRSTIDGVPIHTNTNSLVSALFMHDTSRNLDPQLHTHAIIANATFDPEKGWKTLSSERLSGQNFTKSEAFTNTVFANKLTFGALYRQFLKEDLAEKGYEFETVGKNGLWEIKGVPTEIFSTRRQEILEASEPNASAKSLSITAKDTRKPKDFTGIEELREEWKQRLSETGFKKEDLIKPKQAEQEQGKAVNGEKIIDLGSAVKEAVSELAKDNVKFSYDAILTKVINRIEVKDGIMLEARKAIDSEIKKGELIAVDKDQTYFTTQKHLADDSAVSSLIFKLNESRNELKGEANSVIASHLINGQKDFNLFKVKGGVSYESKVINDLQQVADSNNKEHIIVVPNKATKYDVLKEGGYKGDIYTVGDYLKLDASEKGSLVTVYRSEKIALDKMKLVLEKAQNESNIVTILDTGGTKKTGLVLDIATSVHEIKATTLSETQENKRLVIFEGVDKGDRLDAATKLYTTLAFNNKQAVLQIKGKDAQAHLTAKTREHLAESGLLSERGTIIPTKQSVFVNDYKDRSSYKVGYTLEKTVRGKTESYRIESVNDSTNKLALVNTKTGEQSAISVSKLNSSYSVYRDVEMDVKIGERLRVTDNFRDLKFGQQLSVVDIKPKSFLFREKLIVQDAVTGKQFSIPTNQEAKLAYGYVEPLGSSKRGQNENVIAVLSQSDTNSKEVSDIKRGGDNILIITSSSKDSILKTVETDNTQVTVTNSLKKMLDANNLSEIKDKSIENAKSLLDRTVDNHIEKEMLNSKDKVVFTGVKVVTSVTSAGQDFTIAEVRQNLNERIQRGELVPVSNDKSLNGSFITRENLEREKYLLGVAMQGKGVEQAVLSDLSGVKLEGLTKGQKDAASMILSSNDSVTLIQGYAGVGKTTQLSVVIDAVQKFRPDMEIIGIAPTHKAVSEMKAVGMNDASTVASFLQRNIGNDISSENAFKDKLFIIDEASMIGTKQMVQLFDSILQGKGRIVLTGDYSQLKAFDSGSPLRLLYERGVLDKSTMAEIVRQEDSLKPAVQYAIENKVPRSLVTIIKNEPLLVDRKDASLAPEESLVDTKGLGEGEAYKLVVNDYMSRTNEERDNTMVITPLNVDRKGLNEAIHKALHQAGDVGQSQLIVPRYDRVNSTQADINDPVFWKTNIGNIAKHGKSYFTIASVTENGIITLRNEQGDTKILDALRVNNVNTAVFKEEYIALSEGDKIRVTATDRDRIVENNALGRVESIEDGKLTLQINGKVVTYDPVSQAGDRHIDYGYAGTDYANQGGSYRNVMIFIDNVKHATLDAYYVQVSRAKHHVQAYINDVVKYIDQVSFNTGNRLTALETLEQSDMRASQNQEAQNVVVERQLWDRASDVDRLKSSGRLPVNLVEMGRFAGDKSEIILPVYNEEGAHRGNYHIPINPYRGEVKLDQSYYQGGSDGTVIVLNKGDDQKEVREYSLPEMNKAINNENTEHTIVVKLEDKLPQSESEQLPVVDTHAEFNMSVQEGLALIAEDDKSLEAEAKAVALAEQESKSVEQEQQQEGISKLGNDEVNILHHQSEESKAPVTDKGLKEKELV